MAEDVAVQWSAEIKDLGDKIVALTVARAVELGNYLEKVHNIKPAASAVAVTAGPAAGGAAAAEKPRNRPSSRSYSKALMPPRRLTSSRSSARSPAWA